MKLYWKLVRIPKERDHPWRVECLPWCWGPLCATRTIAVLYWIRYVIPPINSTINWWQRWRHRRKLVWVNCQKCNGCGRLSEFTSCPKCSGTGLRIAVIRARVKPHERPKGL